MPVKLPKPVAAYFDAYNARDVKGAVACFYESAVVHDEGNVHRGAKAIGDWMKETIGKYGPRLEAKKVEPGDQDTVVTVTVSGSFPGSPVSLPFRFTIDNDNGLVTALTI